MDITTPESRKQLYVSIAVAHLLGGVILMTVGWFLMNVSQPSFALQPNGQFAVSWPWTWYVGMGLIGMVSLPILLPALLLLPEGWSWMLLLLLPINSGLIGYGLGQLYIRRRIRQGDADWRISHWQCPECGYDLTGSMTAVACPECGEAIPAKLRKHFEKLREESRAYRPPA